MIFILAIYAAAGDILYSLTEQISTLQPCPASFYIDYAQPAVGIVYKNGSKTDPKEDFCIDLDLDPLVEAGSNTGYLATFTLT